MIETVFLQINRVINQCILWCIAIDEKIPFLKIFLGVFLVYQLARFFIWPMMKSGSDKVEKPDARSKKK